MPQPPVEMVLGTRARWILTLRDAQGRAVTDFLETDPVSASVWAGDDRIPLFSPEVEWVDPLEGTLAVSIRPAMTVTAEVATYRLQVFVTPPSDDQRRCVWDGSIRFLPTAGAGEPDPVYATSEDLFDYCPRLERHLADEEAAQAGFAEQRARARKWLDDTLLRNYYPVPGRTRRMVNLAGTAAGPYSVFADPPEGAAIPSEAQLRAILDAGGLVVTDAIRELVSHKAAAYAYRTSTGPYGDEATEHDREANRLWYVSDFDVKTDPDLASPDLRIGRDVTFLT